MPVFDDIIREGEGARDHNERAFAYLNRSARSEGGRVRELVERWFARYPAAHRDRLISRFRPAIDDSHVSAFFELFLHELILVRGHTVLAIEPSMPGTKTSPDFLIQSREGHRFYLEAVLATGRSREEAGAEARLNDLLTAIDDVGSPRHFLDLHMRGMPAKQVSTKAMKRRLKKWVEGLPDGDAAKEVAPFVFEEAGVRIILTAWPRRNPEAGGGAIGVQHFPFRDMVPHTGIRAALSSKAGHYGEPDYPLVLAINSLQRFRHESAVLDALLDTSRVTIHTGQAGNSISNERAPDGVWVRRHGPNNRRLSAVLSTAGVNPWHFGLRASRPYPKSLAKEEAAYCLARGG